MALTAQQLAERTRYLGASDAAAVLGLSRWKSPRQVWAEKVGAVPIEDKSDELPIMVGNELESLVRRLYQRETGVAVHPGPETLYHKAYPFIAVNLDGRINEHADFEAKTCGGFKGDEWEGEEIPAEYICQGYHSMAVTGKPTHVIACLIGNHDFVHKTFARDEDIIGEMLEREVFFWRKYVEKKRMPPEVSKLDGGLLFKLFPKEDGGKPIALGDAANRLADSRAALLKDKRVLTGELARLDNALKDLLRERSWGKSDRYKVSWRNQERASFDAKALRKALPDVYERFVRRDEERVLRVTERRIARRKAQ